MSHAAKVENRAGREAAPRFTWGQRIALPIISVALGLAVRIIGCTLRFECSCEDPGVDPLTLPELPAICPFWHGSVFAAMYIYRNRQIAVMTSRSFDGEYIARTASHLGFIPVRGSSSRGAVGALIGMRKIIEEGKIAAFTIDGPRGPRFVAKPGPVALAKHTGAPIRAFYVAVDRHWTLNSWDRLMIPKPFSRAHTRIASAIYVPANATDEQSQQFHAAMQAALERVTAEAERLVQRRG